MPIEFSRTYSQTILEHSFDGVNPTYCRLAFEFLFSLTSREGNLGQGGDKKLIVFVS
jgi:hypothetical protein